MMYKLINFYIPLFPSLQHVNSENLQNPRRKHDRKVQPRRQQRERREVETMFGKRKKVVDIRSILVHFGLKLFHVGGAFLLTRPQADPKGKAEAAKKKKASKNCQRRSFEVKNVKFEF